MWSAAESWRQAIVGLFCSGAPGGRTQKNSRAKRSRSSGPTFQVAGIFQTADAIESNTILAPLADVQELMGRPGQVSEFQIRAAPGNANEVGIARLCRDIEALRDPSGRSFGFKALPTQQFVNTDTETRLTSAMAWGTSIVAIGLSLVAMLNTMLMSVLERTKEFGLLRAVGWTRGRVIRMILGESLADRIFASAGREWLGAGLFVRGSGHLVVHSQLRPAESLGASRFARHCD